MPQNDETAASGQDDTCDCMVCAIRRASQARYGNHLSRENLIELLSHLGYASGAFLALADVEGLLAFQVHVESAQIDSQERRPRGTKH